ncbi:MAG: hypothetical protein ABI680_20465 [Chthoniobacteraceae bacterium]
MTSSIQYQCAHCGEPIEADAVTAGSHHTCAACHRSAPVPDVAPPDGGDAPVRVREPSIISVEMKFRCPDCNTKYSANVEISGWFATCLKCGTTLRIPAWSSEPKPRAVESPGFAQLTPAEIAFLSSGGSDAANELVPVRGNH